MRDGFPPDRAPTFQVRRGDDVWTGEATGDYHGEIHLVVGTA